MLPRTRWLLATLLLLAAAGPALPCNVPVFRYALERWKPDDYAVTVFRRGPLTPEQIQYVERMRKLGHNDGGKANLSIDVVDVGGDLDRSLAPLWQAHKDAALPWVVVQEPDPEEGTSWQAIPLADEAGFRKLTDSPARRKIAEHLLKGEAIVWLLIESGDAKADAEAAELLQKTSAKLAKELKLPEGIGEPDSKLFSSLPLKISFATVRVSRTDPAEKPFVALLGHLFADAAKATGPAVIPIFGRGRALDVVTGDDLTAATLTDAAVFLTGRCSCQVKRLNPGVDLLFSIDWESIFAEDTADPGRSSQEVPLVALPEATTPAADEPADVAPPAGTPPRLMMLSLLAAGGVLVLGTVLVTVFLLRRGGVG